MAPTARGGPGTDATEASTRSSEASGSLVPSRPKNLMPLSRHGLCDAETTTARSSPSRRTRIEAAGVGTTPAMSASPPPWEMPAARADSSIGPDSRVSRTISTCGRSACASAAAARPSATASSAVSFSPATPRTPSVPNSFVAMRPRS